jgi:hypothetical protein
MEEQCLETQEDADKDKNSKAYRTTSHKALRANWDLPNLNWTGKLNTVHNITITKELDGSYDTPKNYREWPHPADAINLRK